MFDSMFSLRANSMADDSRRLRQDLCKLFTKFKKKELHQGLIERGILQEDYPDTEGSKKSFVSRILDSCYHGEVTKDQVALMDLLYHQTYPNCKKWIVYKLEGFEPGKKLNISDPWKFKSKLKSSLEHYFKVDIFVHLWKNSLWTRLHFCEGSSSSLLSNTVYIIYYPNAQYIFMSSIKAAYKQYILQALSSLLHCQALEEINLSGRDVFSLKELLLNKSSQGAFSKYKLNQIDMNPLSRKRKREIDANMKPLNQEITNENKEEEQKRHQIADNAFGPNPQPVLERVEFKMRTRLRSGSQDFPQLNNPISCSVKFEGTSIIEGIKNLGAQTFVSVPLPSYLANLHSLARNTFSLTEKKKADNEEGRT